MTADVQKELTVNTNVHHGPIAFLEGILSRLFFGECDGALFQMLHMPTTTRFSNMLWHCADVPCTQFYFIRECFLHTRTSDMPDAPRMGCQRTSSELTLLLTCVLFPNSFPAIVSSKLSKESPQILHSGSRRRCRKVRIAYFPHCFFKHF